VSGARSSSSTKRGLSERPHRVRTWALRGQTPVLQYYFNWKVVSAATGITWWSFYFRLYPTTIRGPPVVDFLGHRLSPCRASCWWSGTGCHSTGRGWSRSISARTGRLAIERSPGYAPELNPAEHIWVTGSITSYPTSARAISPSPAIRPAAPCAACAGTAPLIRSLSRRDRLGKLLFPCL